MGVSGLAGYVSSNGLLSTGSWSKRDVPINIIIGGTALVFHLYEQKFNWVVGGQYLGLQQEIQKFFRDLEKCGFHVPVVVFEGIRYVPGKQSLRTQRDVGTTLKIRAQLDEISKNPTQNFQQSPNFVLPLLAIPVAVEAIKNLGINVEIANGDSDYIIACLAKKHNSLVLSNDSDFLLFPLSQPYLDIKFFSMEDKKAKFSMFDPKKLAQKLNIPVRFLPLLAPVLGNDYLSTTKLKNIRDGKNIHDLLNRLSKVINSLPKDSSLDTVISKYIDFLNPVDPLKWKQKFKEVSERYLNLEKNIDSLKYSPGKVLYGDLTDIRDNVTFFCTPLMEDLRKTSVWKISTPIRQYGYFKQHKSYVIEHMRCDLKEKINTCKKEFMIQEIKVYSQHRNWHYHEFVKNKDLELLGNSLLFLISCRLVTIKEVMCAVFAACTPKFVKYTNVKSGIKNIDLNLDSIHFIGTLETTIFSMSVANEMTIMSKNVPDGLMINIFLSLFSIHDIKGSFKKIVYKVALEHAPKILNFFEELEHLGKIKQRLKNKDIELDW